MNAYVLSQADGVFIIQKFRRLTAEYRDGAPYRLRIEPITNGMVDVEVDHLEEAVDRLVEAKASFTVEFVPKTPLEPTDWHRWYTRAVAVFTEGRLLKFHPFLEGLNRSPGFFRKYL